MNNWMRRRIERSRARCERAATNNKNGKEHEADKQPKLSTLAAHESDAKDN